MMKREYLKLIVFVHNDDGSTEANLLTCVAFGVSVCVQTWCIQRQ